MNMIQKLKKNKKGFTLVELLVVLVILAILAAAIIPSMMGFIDKAKEESTAAECRNVLLGGEVVLNEWYGLKAASDAASYDFSVSGYDKAEVIRVAGVAGSITSMVATKADNKFSVTDAVYVSEKNGTYTYKDGVWNQTEKP